MNHLPSRVRRNRRGGRNQRRKWVRTWEDSRSPRDGKPIENVRHDPFSFLAYATGGVELIGQHQPVRQSGQRELLEVVGQHVSRGRQPVPRRAPRSARPAQRAGKDPGPRTASGGSRVRRRRCSRQFGRDAHACGGFLQGDDLREREGRLQPGQGIFGTAGASRIRLFSSPARGSRCGCAA